MAFARVESGSITGYPSGNQGISIGDYNYPRTIFTLWSESERNAIGIYTIEIDETNLKDERYYKNGALEYTFSGGKVKGAYKSATGKTLTDTKWTQEQIDAGAAPSGATTDTVAEPGLKTYLKEELEVQCAQILQPSDWMAVKAFEESGDVPSAWKTWRGNVRTKCNSMQTQIENAADVAAIEALYTRNGSGVRPLGDFPIKE